jgi:uncharacterized membrane protein YdjX (TVP38/TMEM64 family)
MVSAEKKKLPVAKLALALVVVLIVAALLLRGFDWRALFDRGMALIRGAGPLAFFTAMAILPALGVPTLAFSLTAGPVFGERLGMGMVVLYASIALVINLVVAYGLARMGLRPILEKLINRLGYKLPQAEAGDATDLIVILRVTPGIPFCVQNYLLGLAEIPFGKYFIVSSILALPQNAGFVLFGDALLHGKGKMLLVTGGLLVAIVAATHLLRKHYARKKTAA